MTEEEKTPLEHARDMLYEAVLLREHAEAFERVARAIFERELRQSQREEEEGPGGAVVRPLRPRDDDTDLAGLRARHRGWHIWRNGTGWHAVKDAHSDPVTEATAARLDARLGPAEPEPQPDEEDA